MSQKDTPKNIFSYRKYWAHRFGIAENLPMTRKEMEQLGWDSCDIIIVTGDAYVDHPSFGMAVIGRSLEAQGFRVGIVAQPDWTNTEDFCALGTPNLFIGVTSGNMDSMINRYTADRKIRSNDAYTPDGAGGKRPDRSTIVYSQRCREAHKNTPIIIGGIEASLRRIAHYDYWSDTVRRSILLDAKADLLVYGNGERQIIEIAHRLARKEPVKNITDIRGTAFVTQDIMADYHPIDATQLDDTLKTYTKVKTEPYQINPYKITPDCNPKPGNEPISVSLEARPHPAATNKLVICIPDYNAVKSSELLYAHASRQLHLETNPGNAKAIFQRHGKQGVWLNPPALPLKTKELDQIFELPYTRMPHKVYAKRQIPAYDMIKTSINIMRGCFGGCTFCSITEHEGRLIQNRSEASILNEIKVIRDSVPGFTGVISDLGGPTANMYRLACKSETIEAACRRPSCVYPKICSNLNTNHDSLIHLYRSARKIPGIKKILIASGLRYDLAIQSPEYVKELVTHHVGGYLKIAPEHTESGPLANMMKPNIDSYYEFKQLFDRFSKEAGKEQYLIPYFIAAHPGTTDEDMLNLALWLKHNGFRADQVQSFIPSPLAVASAMYHTGLSTLRKVSAKSENVSTPKGLKVRRLHKAFLRYHDPDNWPLLRDALKRMGRADLIGSGKQQLIPRQQPIKRNKHADNSNNKRRFRTSNCHSLPTKTHKQTHPRNKY